MKGGRRKLKDLTMIDLHIYQPIYLPKMIEHRGEKVKFMCVDSGTKKKKKGKRGWRRKEE